MKIGAIIVAVALIFFSDSGNAKPKKPKGDDIPQRIEALEAQTEGLQEQIDESETAIMNIENQLAGLEVPSRFVFVDSEGTELGPVVDLATPQDAGVIVGLEATHGHIQTWMSFEGGDGDTESVWFALNFETSDCSGTPYIRDEFVYPGLGLTPTVITPVFAVDMNDGVSLHPTGEQMVYAATGALTSIVLRSRATRQRAEGGFFCESQSGTEPGPALSAELVGDLTEIYPPPYDVIAR